MGSQSFETKFALVRKLCNNVVWGFDYLILVEVMDYTKYNQMKESKYKDLTNVSYSCRPASSTAFLTMSLSHSSADPRWWTISAALNCKCTYKNIKINTKISL